MQKPKNTVIKKILKPKRQKPKKYRNQIEQKQKMQ